MCLNDSVTAAEYHKNVSVETLRLQVLFTSTLNAILLNVTVCSVWHKFLNNRNKVDVFNAVYLYIVWTIHNDANVTKYAPLHSC